VNDCGQSHMTTPIRSTIHPRHTNSNCWINAGATLMQYISARCSRSIRGIGQRRLLTIIKRWNATPSIR